LCAYTKEAYNYTFCQGMIQSKWWNRVVLLFFKTENIHSKLRDMSRKLTKCKKCSSYNLRKRRNWIYIKVRQWLNYGRNNSKRLRPMVTQSFPKLIPKLRINRWKIIKDTHTRRLEKYTIYNISNNQRNQNKERKYKCTIHEQIQGIRI
jgi:hypothetical protein